VLGAVGAVLAIPGAAMIQAVLSETGTRHEVIDSHLTTLRPRKARRAGSAKRHPTAQHDDDT
jgi:hypothetical protein